MSPSAVVLFLALLVPGQPVQTFVQAMPSEAVCKAAERDWLSGEPDAAAIKQQPAETRYAICLRLPAVGKDT